jgi:allantoate deiminase
MHEPIKIDRGRVAQRLEAFATFGAYGKSGVWRTLYSPEWVDATDQFADWCIGAGLAVNRDSVGNVWGRLEGSEGGKSIVSGSHIDTVTPGGRYDGALGTIGALIAIEALAEQSGKPKRTLEAVALCEEESSRFRANFWGSRAIIGKIAPEVPDQIVGFDGITISDAMREVGLDPELCYQARRRDIDAFIELHIEQGPVLEAADCSVALVTGIAGLRGITITLEGVANHAGAFPMQQRKDPVAGFAEIVSGVIGIAKEMGSPAVTTIGRVNVEPNLATIIPGKVEFTIDARHADADELKCMITRQDELMNEVAARLGFSLSAHVTSQHEACVSDPELMVELECAAGTAKVNPIKMVSGAAHDTQQISKIARTAMIFVRSQGGRSHTPEEFSSLDDIVDGIKVLAGTLHRLAY